MKWQVYHYRESRKSIRTDTCINQLLLAGVERVALVANLNVDVTTGGTSFDLVAACTSDGGFLVLRMDAFSHSGSPLSGFDSRGHALYMRPSQPSKWRLPAYAILCVWSSHRNDCSAYYNTTISPSQDISNIFLPIFYFSSAAAAVSSACWRSFACCKFSPRVVK